MNFSIENNDINIYTLIKNKTIIPGILILNGKTFGKENLKKKKFYYKCVPYNKNLPHLLISYELKNNKFNKKIINKFVLFIYNKWNDKHPIGILSNIIGELSDFESYIQYSLYCKNLNISIKDFINITNRNLKNISSLSDNLFDNIITLNPNIENRINWEVITIDPDFTTDFDDALGIYNSTLSIYITNVPLIFDFLNLWDSISSRVSSIYLPEKKINMLPSILSENICSLIEGEERLALSMDIFINEEKELIDNIEFKSTIIKVKKNYSYNNVFTYKNIKKIYLLSNIILKIYPLIDKINDSHHLIEFLMLLFNYKSAMILNSNKCGIFRSLKINNLNLFNEDKNIPSIIFDFMRSWKSLGGEYVEFNNLYGHDLIGKGVPFYIHITSPIRRIVDILNMIIIQEILFLYKFNDLALKFYNNWVSKLKYINQASSSTRKIQDEIFLLNNCIKNSFILEKTYNGYIIDKTVFQNYLHYVIYLPELKLISKLKEITNITNLKNISEMTEFSCYKFKLFLIEEEITLKKKIRIEKI